MAVMAQPVENGAGQGRVVIEGGGPLGWHFVGGEDNGGALVAGADDLEQEVAALLIQGEISEFVEDEQLWVCVLAQGGRQAVSGKGALQPVDHVDGVCEEDVFSGKGGGVSDGGGQVSFSQAGVAEEQEVFLAFQEPESQEAFDGLTGDFLWPVPVESVEVFEDGKASLPHTALGAFVVASAGFDFNEVGEVADVIPTFACGLAG